MPTAEQRQAIEANRLALRIVDEGTEVNSGSCYYLYPVKDDWDKRLINTCATYCKASRTGKALYLLADLIDVRSGQFSNETFEHGRVTGNPRIVAKAEMYGTETPENIARWALRGITSLVPKIQVSSPPTSVATASEPSAFASCCTQIAYLFTCCFQKEYSQVANEADDTDFR